VQNEHVSDRTHSVILEFPVTGESARVEIWYDNGRPTGDDDFEGECWASVCLEGAAQDAVGPERTAGAHCVVQICQRRLARRSGLSAYLRPVPRSELSWHKPGQKFGSYAAPEWRFDFDDAPAGLERVAACEWTWEFDLEEALAELQKARDWLFTNEEDLDRSLDGEGSPAILRAWSKMSTQLQDELSDSSTEAS
jgi:hypothetical protein